MTVLSSQIPHSRPLLGEREEAAALRVLRSGMLAQGPEVAAFEKALADCTGTGHCVAVGHGTGALHLVLLEMGAGPGAEVVLPAYSCISLLNAVLYTGARPVLADSVPGGSNLDLSRVDLADTTSAVVVTHMFGEEARVTGLGERVVEDCTHFLGAPFRLQGRAAVYSFYATKMLAGGEGGAVVTNDAGLAARVEHLRSYDCSETLEVRYNYKMTDLAAALLRVQLERLEEFVARRRDIAATYREAFTRLPDVELPPAAGVDYRFVLRVRGRDLDQVITALRDRGVNACRPVFRPLHHYFNLPAGEFPAAEAAFQENLSLPIYPALKDREVAEVCEAVRSVLQ